jgi:Ca-activated chloride channel family protein
VRAAQRSMLTGYTGDRINAVVVLTDGKNEYPRDNDLDALLRDIDAGNLERSVRVFAIAFGDKSDLGTLSSIARSSRAAAYDARNPSSITDVFVSVLSNF